MLAFIGIRPGMVALDISAGGGYTTELLARAIGPTGVVYGQSLPRDASTATPAAPEGNSAPAAQADVTSTVPPAPVPRRTSREALAEREISLQTSDVPAARIIAVVQKFEDPVPANRKAQGLDLVTLMFNYHDLGFMGVDRAQMNRAVFGALKSGEATLLPITLAELAQPFRSPERCTASRRRFWSTKLKRRASNSWPRRLSFATLPTRAIATRQTPRNPRTSSCLSSFALELGGAAATA